MSQMLKIAGFGAILALAIVSAAYLSGFFYGKKSRSDKEMQQRIEAFYAREQINEDTQKLDDVGLCVALGGLSDACASLMRRLDKATAGK